MATDSIGTRIRKRRQVLGMTQDDLATKLNVSRSTVANWESGKHFPLRYAGAVEKVLGVELSDDTPGPEYDDPALQRIWDRLQPLDLDDDVKRGMVELARQLLARRQESQRRRALSRFAVGLNDP